MTGGSWTDEENDRIVADYFAMLRKELDNERYVKIDHNRRLQAEISRGHGSIERKHQNISAILRLFGMPRIRGYAPAKNYQLSLLDAIERQLDRIPDHDRDRWQPALPKAVIEPVLAELPIGAAPTQRNRPMQKKQRELLRPAVKFDFPGRDARNQALGRAGEKRVLMHEQAVLTREGRSDLARDVRWVSRDEGDGAGYDIASFAPDGRTRLIEVKTTNGWQYTPFFITRNELEVSERCRDEWSLMRVWDFAHEAKAFELHPPLATHVELIATHYRAEF